MLLFLFFGFTNNKSVLKERTKFIRKTQAFFNYFLPFYSNENQLEKKREIKCEQLLFCLTLIASLNRIALKADP